MIRTTIATVAMAALAVGQTATFTTYGSGCTLPGNPPPLIQAVTMPQIGSTFTVRHVALPAGQNPVSTDLPAILIGLQTTATPVPVLSSLQPAGCNFLNSADVAVIMPWSGTSYPNTFSMQLPNNPGLLGFPFHLQWASLYIRLGMPQMIRTTNGGTATVGL